MIIRSKFKREAGLNKHQARAKQEHFIKKGFHTRVFRSSDSRIPENCKWNIERWQELHSGCALGDHLTAQQKNALYRVSRSL